MHLSDSDYATLLRLNYETCALKLELSFIKVELAFRAGFNPNQPRVPRGNPDGGQWTRVGGGGGTGTGQVGGAYNRSGSPVDLAEEERLGGHTVTRHVGRSANSLLVRVRGERFLGLFYTIARSRDGSFPSLAAANKLVNATLSRNTEIVDAVAKGSTLDAFITATFASKTGIEAYRPSANSQPYIRDTYGVGVIIVHDPKVPKGYRVITAYPRND